MNWTIFRKRSYDEIIRKTGTFFGVVLGLCFAASLHASPERIYFIGNSFTWDAQPHNISTNTVFPNDLEPTVGFSIYSGKSLNFIVANPEDAVTEVGLVASDFYPDPNYTRNFQIDLADNPWEAISVQPHTQPNGRVLFEEEVAAAHTIIQTAQQNAANQNTVYYILGPWAFQESPDKNNGRTYSENWGRNYSNNSINSGELFNVRGHFRSLFWERLKSENPGVTIKWIPVGEVVYRIDQRLQNGAIPGLSGAWDLFDAWGVHLHDTDADGIAGRYISHITTLSTIWGFQPEEFQTKYDGVIDKDFKALVDEVAWNTITDLYPNITGCVIEEELDGNLIRHPGLPGDYLKSSYYAVKAKLENEEIFKESAVLEYATRFGEDPLINDPFNITNSKNRDALADSSHWTNVSYGNDGNALQFEITLSSGDPIFSCEAYPGRYNISPSIKDGNAYLTFTQPNRYLYLIINENEEQPLFLFIDPLEENPPSEGDEAVLYFGPGIHDIGMNFEFPQDKDTIYLALGAYVKGSIFAEGRSNISIRGRGILSGESYGLDPEVNAAVHFKGNGSGQLLEGITSIRPLKYHVISRGTLHTRNLKCLSYNNTTDGIFAGNDSVTEHCFFKVNDDVIKLYYDHQTVRDIVVYHQTNSPVFEFGWSGQSSSNSIVQRIDIVEDNTMGADVDGHAILGWAHNSQAGGTQSGHILEDIRAENGSKRLLHFNIDNAYGFLDILCRNWNIQQTEDISDLFVAAPGSIEIGFENVIVDGRPVGDQDFENVGGSDLQLNFNPIEEDLPNITIDPESSLVNLGDSITLALEAEGPGALNYQWRKDGVNLPGATGSTFMLQTISEAGEGMYDVVVSNLFGSVTSQRAYLSFSKLNQNLQFSPLKDQSIQEKSVALSAESDAGLEVTLEVVSGPAYISENKLFFTGHGEVTIRASQSGGSVWKAADPVERTFTIYSQASTWRQETLGTYENIGEAADLADPDFDRIPNLLEYLLGSSPMERTDMPILRSLPKESYFQYKFVQSAKSIDGLLVVVEMSSNLRTWTTLPAENVFVLETEEGDLEYLIRTNSLQSPHFVRINVESL